MQRSFIFRLSPRRRSPLRSIFRTRMHNRPENSDFLAHSSHRSRQQGGSRFALEWTVPIRKTARATDQRTLITTPVRRAGMSDRAPLLGIAAEETAALVVALLNSFVIDFAARSAVGGTDLSYFIIKQLPIIHPDRLEDDTGWGCTYAEFIAPRVLELSYTSSGLRSFAEQLGHNGPPFPWNDDRRFLARCEIDAAIFPARLGSSLRGRRRTHEFLHSRTATRVASGGTS